MDVATIQKRIDQLEKLNEEVRINKEMLKGELENEPAYLEASEEVKGVTQKRKQIKDEILGKGPNQEVLANIKSSMEEITTLRDILSAELTEYYQENNSDEIIDASGIARKFKISVKLMPKKAGYEKRNGFGQYEE
jgi:hypothetical protein